MGGTSCGTSAKSSFQNMVSLVAGWVGWGLGIWVGLGLGDDGRDLGSDGDDGDLGQWVKYWMEMVGMLERVRILWTDNRGWGCYARYSG